MKFTARSRLETYASVSRVQSDEETYDLERTVVGSVVAGVTADRCGQCGACDRAVVPVAVGDREIGDMEITTLPEPFGWLEPTGRSPAFHFLRRNKEDGMPVFTADQLRAYAEAAVRAEREACAKEAEKWQEIVTAAIRSRT